MRRVYALVFSGVVLIAVFAVVFTRVDTASGVEAAVYFSDAQAMYLVAEQRIVDSGRLYAALMDELIKGPSSSALWPTIPPGTRVLDVHRSEAEVIVNLSAEFISGHWGGSAGETLTVYSIVHTFSALEGVESVRILVEGKPVETLAGHLFLDQSLKPDLKLFAP
jgi:spore germination protein GerM